MGFFSKTDGITEASALKMEKLSRRTYGFRIFDNYRVRIWAKRGWNGVVNRVW
ncbi:MAG: transposase [Advenella sp.]